MYHRGGSVTELGMESNCTTFAKSLKFKIGDDFNACFFPFTKLNSMSTVRKHELKFEIKNTCKLLTKLIKVNFRITVSAVLNIY